MKVLGLAVIGVGVGIAAVCMTLFFQQPIQQEPIVSTINPYGDTCVVTVTHPDLIVYLMGVEAAEDCCDRCRYWFGVKNLTAEIGTKARDVTVYATYQSGPIGPDGNLIPGRNLYGSAIERMEPIPFEVVKDEVRFWIGAPCPDCLFDDEGCIFFVVQYFDCSGINRYEMCFDLKAQSITINGPTRLPATEDCRC